MGEEYCKHGKLHWVNCCYCLEEKLTAQAEEILKLGKAIEERGYAFQKVSNENLLRISELESQVAVQREALLACDCLGACENSLTLESANLKCKRCVALSLSPSPVPILSTIETVRKLIDEYIHGGGPHNNLEEALSLLNQTFGGK